MANRHDDGLAAVLRRGNGTAMHWAIRDLVIFILDIQFETLCCAAFESKVSPGRHERRIKDFNELAYANAGHRLRQPDCADRLRAAFDAGLFLNPAVQRQSLGPRRICFCTGAAEPVMGHRPSARWDHRRPLRQREGACGGALLYALGLVLMAHSTSAPMLDLSAGVLIGFGLAGCSFPVVLAALGKIVPLQYRSLAFGFGTAAGLFGQFLYSPVAVALMDTFGWQQTLVIFAVSMLAVLPLSLALATPPETTHTGETQSLRQALGEAFAHRSYVLLVLGFFTCGSIHHRASAVLPGRSRAFRAGRRLDHRHHRPVQHCRLGHRRLARRPHAEALSAVVHLFLSRRGDPGVHFVPGHAGHLRGLWRHDGPDVALHGAADQWHHRSDVRHALAGDARRLRLFQPPGRRLPWRLARRPRVRPHRLVQYGVVAGDPVWRALGADQYADRRETRHAGRRGTGLSARRLGRSTTRALGAPACPSTIPWDFEGRERGCGEPGTDDQPSRHRVRSSWF